MAKRSAHREPSASLRATWKGSLKLSLIQIPIQVFPATTASSDVSFRQLHRKCHTPIQLKKWCPHCNVALGPEDIVKGYESSKGRMVVVEEEEIKAVRPESTKTIDISDVVSTETVDPVYIERTYFLAPDGSHGAAAFGVMRDALDGRAAIGRLALHGREYLVAVVARDNAMLMFTLRTAGEVRAVDAVPGLELTRAKARPEEVRLAKQVLDGFASGKDLTAFTDHYQEALRRMLEAKHDEPVAEAEAKPSKVVNLMDALRQSLDQVQAGTKARKPSTARKQARMSHPASPKRRKAS